MTPAGAELLEAIHNSQSSRGTLVEISATAQLTAEGQVATDELLDAGLVAWTFHKRRPAFLDLAEKGRGDENIHIWAKDMKPR